MNIRIDWVEIPGGKSPMGLSPQQKQDLTLRLRDAYAIDQLPWEEQALITALCEKRPQDFTPGEHEYWDHLLTVESPLFRYADAIWNLKEIPDLHTVTLETFYVSRFPITRAQAEFWYQEPIAQKIGWVMKRMHEYDAGSEGKDRPERFKWDGADALAHWLGGRLPTVFEWEKAARGTDARLYPWGNDWHPSAGNLGTRESRLDKGSSEKRKGRVTAVDAYPEGASPYGLMDMIGNLGEWTANIENDYHQYDSPIYMCYHIKEMPAEAQFFWALPVHRRYGVGDDEKYVGCRPMLTKWGRNLWSSYTVRK